MYTHSQSTTSAPKVCYYCPFYGHIDSVLQTSEKDCKGSNIPVLQTNYNIRTGANINQLKSGTHGPLNGLPSEAILLIDGHGSIAGNAIVAQYVTGFGPTGLQKGPLSISAAALAAQLRRDDLPADHRLILMMSCHGGTGDQLHTTSSGVVVWNAPCFAQRLAVALGQIPDRSYAGTLVGGFLGTVFFDGINLVMDDAAHDPDHRTYDPEIPTSDARWFNTQGREIADPFLLLPKGSSPY